MAGCPASQGDRLNMTPHSSPGSIVISMHSAMVLATELVDWRRFEHPHSSGNRERRSYRHRPQIGDQLKARRQGNLLQSSRTRGKHSSDFTSDTRI